MSDSALYLVIGYPSAHINNGIGRFIPQLKRITFKFCKHSGNSRGLRDFIEKDLVDVAKEHPSAAIYLKPRRHRKAVVKAEYLNGTQKWMNIGNKEREEIAKWINLLMKQESGDCIRLKKRIHTDFPSIQGVWAPYTHADLRMNLMTTFPNEFYQGPSPLPKTASELLIQLFKQQEEETQKNLPSKGEPAVGTQENNI